jgi:4-diphosphocytidyl-2-C-methyl-D-erythritol kinase
MLEARPPAKVNLTLEVGARRADGYHDLRSVILRIGLADRLTVAAGIVGEADRLAVSGLPGCPVEGNLVLRAFEALRRLVEPGLPGLRAELDKAIPIGAGLGGGSSDAASAFELAAAAWGIGVSPSEQVDLALGLGSDVPFFAAGVAAALVEGRGERVNPLPAVSGEVGILLALSVTALSTAEVFARYDELPAHAPPGRPTDALTASLARGMSGEALADAADGLREANDLWPAAAWLMPELADRRTVLEHSTGRPWLLSGSGPTLFTLYPSLAEAVEAERRLAGGRPPVLAGVMLCATDLDSPDNAWRTPWPTEP